MFERILETGAPSALKTYAGTYEGKNPMVLATITEGRQLADVLNTQSPRFRNGMQMPPMSLVAIGAKGGPTAKYIPVDEMLDAGFSPDKPIHLQLRVQFGSPAANADEADQEQPGKKGSVMLEVFDACYQIAKARTLGESDMVFAGLFETINAAQAEASK